ncbi:hypothetical protein ISCGN_014454 [Ixodes scapularis]
MAPSEYSLFVARSLGIAARWKCFTTQSEDTSTSSAGSSTSNAKLLCTIGRNNKSTLDNLTKATAQINGMLRRIRNQQHGLKEREAMQLVHAFVVSRVMYGPHI